jgi:hypothetical protein
MAVRRREVEDPGELIRHAEEVEKRARSWCEGLEPEIRMLKLRILRLEKRLERERELAAWAGNFS